jgi:hypothetical protein
MELSLKERNSQNVAPTSALIISPHQRRIHKQNGQVERTNGLLLQGMKIKMFQDLEARGRNWHKELPSVLWALRTNINRATRDTPFNLVYGAEAVLLPEIYLKSARVAHFNEEDQDESRQLDANLLEERRNKALSNVRKYQEALKKYYNKNVVQRELNVGDIVLRRISVPTTNISSQLHGKDHLS